MYFRTKFFEEYCGSFFSSFPCFSNLREKSIHKFQSEEVHTKITCRRMTWIHVNILGFQDRCGWDFLVFFDMQCSYQITRLKKSNSKSRGGQTVGKRIKIELKFLNGICIQEALRSHTIVNPLGHRKRGVAKLGQEGSGIF